MIFMNNIIYRILARMHLLMTAMEDTEDITGTRSLYFNVLTVTKDIALKQA